MTYTIVLTEEQKQLIVHAVEKFSQLHVGQQQSTKEAAAKLLPKGKIDDHTWSIWTKSISTETGLKGKNLFLPLRLALTGMEHGPEMGKLLPLIGYEEVMARLNR